MFGIVASASGTTSEPPSFTKSFCMSTTTSAVRTGSTRTSSWISYSGTSTLLIAASLLSLLSCYLVPEEGGEDRLRAQDHRRPGRREALLDKGLHPKSPRRCDQARHHKGGPDLPRREGDRLEEGPGDAEDQRHREHLDEGEP